MMRPSTTFTREQTALLDAAPNAVLITDSDLTSPGPRILYVNEAFERMTGWPREEIVGRSPRALQGPKTDRTIFSDMKRRLRIGEIWRGETLNYKRDGSPFVMRWSIAPLKGGDGVPYGYIANQEDVTAERRRERAARESDALIARFVDAAPLAVLVTDESLLIRRVNAGAEATFGWSCEDLLGAPIDMLIPERLRAVHREHAARFRTEGTTARWMHGRREILGRRRNGEEFPARASVIRAGAEDAGGYAVILHDLSEERASERRLEESERRFRALFDMSYQFVGMLDPEGRMLEVNRGALDFIDAEAADVRGLPFDATPWFYELPAAAAQVRRAVSRAQAGAFVRDQILLRAPDGDLRTFDFSLRPVFDESGALEFMIPEGRDVTALTRASERLRIKEARLREAQALAKIGHWRLRAGEEALETSEGFLRIVGWAPETQTAPLTALTDMLPPEDREAFADALSRLKAGEDALDLKHAVTLSDGATRMMQTRMTRLHGADGFAVTCVSQDVTEQYAAELALRAAIERAEEASQAKSRFLAMIGHELRTPLNAIIGFSEIIADQIMGPIGEPRYVDYAGDINESGKHLLTLIESVLDVSRLERNAVAMRPSPTSARSFLRAVARLARMDAAYSRVSLDYQEADEATLDVDAALLQQAALNIVRNALKFSPPGEIVTLRGVRDPNSGDYLVRVTDRGPGIPAEEVHKITLPFYQVDSGLNRPHEGSGIGLYLAKSFLDMHDGRLAFDPLPEGGTAVTLRLPAARVAETTR
ncbi:MAG: PAS domain S-box protein [Marivibrio sp.]